MKIVNQLNSFTESMICVLAANGNTQCLEQPWIHLAVSPFPVLQRDPPAWAAATWDRARANAHIVGDTSNAAWACLVFF